MGSQDSGRMTAYNVAKTSIENLEIKFFFQHKQWLTFHLIEFLGKQLFGTIDCSFYIEIPC